MCRSRASRGRRLRCSRRSGWSKRRMAEKFTFTYPGLRDIPLGPIPVLEPALQSFDIFPTRIWQAHLDPFAPLLQRWIKAVLAMRAADPTPAGRTVRQGWNSGDMAVLERPDFAPLKHAIRASCASALGEMGQSNIGFSLQSWINMHDRGGFNFLH